MNPTIELPELPQGQMQGAGIDNGVITYRANQMHEYADKARRELLQRCVEVCMGETRLGLDDERAYCGRLMVESLRALLPKDSHD